MNGDSGVSPFVQLDERVTALEGVGNRPPDNTDLTARVSRLESVYDTLTARVQALEESSVGVVTEVPIPAKKAAPVKAAAKKAAPKGGS